ncbi:MAG TPA: type I glyceraldehyde-3-phosphate dehydrogenase [Anaerolinea thermolimosa]|uniref:Glyceraldehyde-3-phosphate dehydrogenase n=1 Tax=Anaerolinea thermolimosa TaxID=229919 RepID=A0A3D1JHQ0_9CHLR|nr:type I glyceraldehyde-3-phosphate dehydrogenase [Anaerolinea thermolimosa]GAP07165.1 glyceraldehyde-3-phosphate dehydrogenase, type I [Anaerolinea thermolimosa]HCE18013.1 type I glyceraldehyde-3-phosphate dehydrogenase [Anaerolinea thermolimosa]
MSTKIGINGFGRIGRQVLKAIMERYPNELEVVAVNDLFDAKTNAHLFKYDSNYGIFPGSVEVVGNDLVINGHTVKVLAEKDPAKLPWKDLGVEIVIESTGIFTDAKGDPAKGKPGAEAHIVSGGAKKVIISAPAKNEDLTVVLGVNEDKYDPAKHHVISNASCTTNCLAPAAKIVHEKFGILNAVMTTIHSYTNDQVILDQGHKKEMRRSRAAGLNIIPTTTGAAKAVALVIPELKGKFDGYALRVPTPTVSIVDFVATVEKPTTKEELNAAFVEAANGALKGILGVTTGEYMDPLVSMDFKGDSRSSIVDLPSNMVMGGNLVKVVTWYDNEWGYSCRTADLAALLAKKL